MSCRSCTPLVVAGAVQTVQMSAFSVFAIETRMCYIYEINGFKDRGDNGAADDTFQASM